MIHNLKQRYPRSIEWNDYVSNHEEYFWIEVSADSTLGIPFEDLTKQEIDLLSVLFKQQKFTDTQPYTSTLKKEWMDFLHGHKMNPPITNSKQIRLIQCFIHSPSFDKNQLEEAISSFLDVEHWILWESYQKVCIVLFQEEDTIHTLLQDMISTIEADFYIKIQLYVGKVHPIDHNTPTIYKYEQTCFDIGRTFLNKSFLSLVDVFPYLALKGIKADMIDFFIQELLYDTTFDQELIKTIKTYIESNSNASMAAKKLFIHRNSLQYRIEKFIEKTDLDIKSFQDAMVAYLAIILFEKFN
ncbi:PucR family transcriptional regulator [Peribacillus alkalitolerans]|uniref:PucR family transcriptional regulator n=1 Tax=Peribacillus alkalitolerans TaxID=1550385 RepID=UPI0013D5017A|nr:helix-turn-helix domain-containing protein [Peribacillus alkalitolerans]